MSENKSTIQTFISGILAICSLLIVLNLEFRIAVFADEQFVYDPKGRRSPFPPLVTPDGRLLKLDKEPGAVGLTLEGIIFDKRGVSYAIVNTEVVKIGDFVSGYQVLRIEKAKVVLIKEVEPLEIELKKEDE